MPKEMYRCREISLTHDYGQYIVKDESRQGKKKTFENPLEAWMYYWTLVDETVRVRIGDMLESQGRDRYTGQIQLAFEDREDDFDND